MDTWCPHWVGGPSWKDWTEVGGMEEGLNCGFIILPHSFTGANWLNIICIGNYRLGIWVSRNDSPFPIKSHPISSGHSWLPVMLCHGIQDRPPARIMSMLIEGFNWNHFFFNHRWIKIEFLTTISNLHCPQKNLATRRNKWTAICQFNSGSLGQGGGGVEHQRCCWWWEQDTNLDGHRTFRSLKILITLLIITSLRRL